MKNGLAHQFVFLVLLSFLILLFSACSQDALPDDYMDSLLETEQMYEDFIFFRSYMENDYPLYTTLKELSDPDMAMDDFDELIKQCRTNNGLYQHMNALIARINGSILPGRLHILDMMHYQALSELYADSSPWSISLGAQDILDHYQFTLDEMDPYGKLPHSIKELSEKPIDENISSNVEVKVIEEGRTVIIRIDSFDYLYGGGIPDQIHSIRESYVDFFTDLYTNYENYENVIFDITGNSGGYTEFWEDMIVRMNIRDTISWTTNTLYNHGEMNGPAVESLKSSGQATVHKISELPDYPGIDPDAKSQFDSFIMNNYIQLPEENNSPILNGKIWVAVDEATKLEADEFAAFCIGTGFAEVVGRQTGGGGISPKNYFELPNSKFVISTEIGYGLNADGSSNATTGTLPNYISDESEWPLDTCVRIIGGI